MRFSCLTSKFVWVVLDASIYFSGLGNDSSRRVKFDSWFNVMAAYEASWHGPKIIYRFTGIRKRVLRWWRKRPFWFSKKVNFALLELDDAVPRWMFSGPDLLQGFWLRLENKLSFFFGKYHLFRIESFWVDFRCVYRFQLLKVCVQYVVLPNSTRVQSVSEEQTK